MNCLAHRPGGGKPTRNDWLNELCGVRAAASHSLSFPNRTCARNHLRRQSPNASGAQQVMCDFIQGDDMPGESQYLTSGCVSSFTGVWFDTKLSEWKGVDNVTPHLRPSFQSIQQRIRRSGRLACRPPQLLLLAMSENAEFVTCNQLQVEVDFVAFLGTLLHRETMGSMKSRSYCHV